MRGGSGRFQVRSESQGTSLHQVIKLVELGLRGTGLQQEILHVDHLGFTHACIATAYVAARGGAACELICLAEGDRAARVTLETKLALP